MKAGSVMAELFQKPVDILAQVVIIGSVKARFIHSCIGGTMEMEKKMEELMAMHDMFKEFAPCGRMFDFRKDGDGYVIMYIDDADKATPYKVRHMNKDGLFGGCSETSMYIAGLYFIGSDI